MHDGKYTHKDRRERGEDEREAREKRKDATSCCTDLPRRNWRVLRVRLTYLTVP